VTAALPLEGLVVALIGRGSEGDRALVIACAEAGADIALATQERTREQEFAVNSIANEAWTIGRRQFARVMDATDPAAVAAFADEVCDRLGRCDALIAAHDAPSNAPIDELSPDEWEVTLSLNLTAPFLAAQAFGRVMERAGRGVILLAGAQADGDAAYQSARAGLSGLAGSLAAAWSPAGVRVELFPAGAAAGSIVRLLTI
jgi:NAD(P)-dependent dehydrogenase (short-subunit alcohol dehydrogenase family)